MSICRPTYRGATVLRHGRIGEPRRGPEEAVVRLWQNADRLAAGLVTRDGTRLRVLYPGRRSSAAGPDFRDCVLSTDSGDILVGDVEVHVTAGEWSAHGHHVDPNYNGVVLHIVLLPTGRTTTELESRAEAPVAVLDTAGDMPEANMDTPRGEEGPCASAVEEQLDRAGDHRFQSKARGFAIETTADDAEQVLYAGIMDALGYSTNRKPFAALAKSVSMARLLGLRGEPETARLLTIRAMLISASGLMPSVSQEDAERFRAVLRHLPQVEKIAEPWKTFRVRPSNHPLRRIEGAATLVDRAMYEGLVFALARAVRRGNHQAVTRWLSAPPFIGASRARDIAVNVVLPFMYAWGGITRDRELQAASVDIFRRSPSLPDNEITREMKRLLPPGVDTRGARRQQGLIHLYKHVLGIDRSGHRGTPEGHGSAHRAHGEEGRLTAVEGGYRWP